MLSHSLSSFLTTTHAAEALPARAERGGSIRGFAIDVSSLWSELRRRRVVRTTISYVVIATAIGAAADVFLPGLGAPAWALSTVLVLLVLGLPLAVGLAWAYDLTPEGVRRTHGGGRGRVARTAGRPAGHVNQHGC